MLCHSVVNASRRALCSRVLPLAATAFLVAGCAAERTPEDGSGALELSRTVPTAPAAPTAADTARAISFICDDMFRFTLLADGDSGTLFLPDSTLRLERTPSPIGARYARAGMELWHDSAEATLDMPGFTYSACTARPGADPFAAARMRGASFRAVGQEPGWYLEISPHDLTFVGDYGERTVRTPAPSQRDAGDRVEWHAATQAHDVRVVAERRPCSDGMSGEAFRWSVVVTVDGAESRGCGRRLSGPLP